MSPIARLAGVSLDTNDPKSLAIFYRDFLELDIAFESDDFIALKDGSFWLTTQRVEDYRAPDWPGAEVPKQAHMEFSVKDLDAAQARAVELGASLPLSQTAPESWRVLLDPAGHPFCITTLIPED